MYEDRIISSLGFLLGKQGGYRMYISTALLKASTTEWISYVTGKVVCSVTQSDGRKQFWSWTQRDYGLLLPAVFWQ